MLQNRCYLNDFALKGIRRNSREYQAVMIDLYLTGVIDKTVAEGLLGYEIPDYIHAPECFDEPAAVVAAEHIGGDDE